VIKGDPGYMDVKAVLIIAYTNYKMSKKRMTNTDLAAAV
jgi:hypothetical protein